MTEKQTAENYFEKYYDEKYKRHYYYNPFTKDSIWEVPKDATIVDRTETAPKKEETVDDLVKQFKQQQEKLAQEQNDAFQALIPDIITQPNELQNKKQQEIEQKIFDEELEKFREFKDLQTHEWMQRPARRQALESKKDAAYVEGNFTYNIWYDKFATDRNAKNERAPSLYRCKPELDTGYTKADKFEKRYASYFCVYFARGECTEGVNCRYYHRVPQEEDVERSDQDNLKDVFGRSRHSKHKDDLTGIGSFNQESRTLLISNIQLDPDKQGGRKPVPEIVRILYENFSLWGEIEDISFDAARFTASIKYSHRFYTEFAKEAMSEQVLVEDVTDPIIMKWQLESDDVDEQLKKQSGNTKQTIQDRAKQDPQTLVPQLAGKKRQIKAEQKNSRLQDKLTNEADPQVVISNQNRLKKALEEIGTN